MRTVTTKQKVRVKGKIVTRTTRRQVVTRPWVQVSRLGNPLVNEAVIPTTHKDAWNASTPDKDSQFAQYYTDPILAAVMNTLFPGVINAPEHNRDDLVAVLLTGVPGLNATGTTQADELRLNLSTPVSANPSETIRMSKRTTPMSKTDCERKYGRSSIRKMFDAKYATTYNAALVGFWPSGRRLGSYSTVAVLWKFPVC